LTEAYAAIDLKSFYASVECMERGLDPMTTNLVVADSSRTNKTICLAVSPSLKAMGVPSRPRLFEVEQRVAEINTLRRQKAPGRTFSGKSWHAPELDADPSLELDYIAAPPRMRCYIQYSSEIYNIYLKYVAPEDIHVYSIDEVFIRVTPYLRVSGMTPRQFIQKIILDIRTSTGITATAGIGTNLYLCKIAMDILAKHADADIHGVRIAELDEMTYRRQLWDHRPLTDFWRIGRGYAKKLASRGMYTMGDVALCSLKNEDLLYRLFGINAELLIDHAWGWEPCTIRDIKSYRPISSSTSSGQVLHEPYEASKARIIVREMADQLSLDLVEKSIVTDQMTLTVGYDIGNLTDPDRCAAYHGAVVTDHYGRKIPVHAHGTANLGRKTASTRLIVEAMLDLYDRIVDPALLVRRITLCANHLTPRTEAEQRSFLQLDLFAGYDSQLKEEAALEREFKRQQAELAIKQKYGKNAILKGMNFREGATTRDRNRQIGGHKA